MTDTYLSSGELRELTGCAHRARQKAWLDRNRWNDLLGTGPERKT